MWCAFSPRGTSRNQTRRGRPGSRSFGTPRTVSGVSICFNANRLSCARIGCSWRWTNFRRIVGFGVHRGVVDGVALCRMFNRATRGHTPPRYLSSDHDPLYRFQQWQANLRILDVKEIKTVPDVPLSHPFVERLIGTIRRECLDRTLFWTVADLEMKLVVCENSAHRTTRPRGRRT